MNIPLGPLGKLAPHFEDIQEFLPEAKPIVDMYEEVLEKIFRVGRSAISNDEYRKEAIIWKSAAITLEAILGMYSVANDYCDGPDKKIDYDWLKHLAGEVKKIGKEQ